MILNKPSVQVEYFIIPGRILIRNQKKFGKYTKDPQMPGIPPKYLEDFREKWDVFDK